MLKKKASFINVKNMVISKAKPTGSGSDSPTNDSPTNDDDGN